MESNEERAYVDKELLKEDLSLRIAETYNSAGALFAVMTFAPQQVIEEGNNTELEELKLKALHKTGLVKDLLQKRIADIQEVTQERKIARVIDPQTFGFFLIDFYKLWMASKHQLSDTHYKPKVLKQEVADLFRNSSIGYSDPRRTLELYESYMNVLADSGIIDFKIKKLTVGERIGRVLKLGK